MQLSPQAMAWPRFGPKSRRGNIDQHLLDSDVIKEYETNTKGYETPQKTTETLQKVGGVPKVIKT